jgi:hypothetical protein
VTVERWAQRVVEEELQQTVELHDDQSQPSMYDLRVGPVDAPTMAIECVGAVDPLRVETWNIGPAKGPLSLALEGDWTVFLMRNARIKGLEARLEPILRRCEETGAVTNLHVDWALRRSHPDLYAELRGLRVQSANCYRWPGRGKVYLTMEGIGGAVDEDGTTIPPWIGDFLGAPERADVLSKLAKSGAAGCEAFVIVDFGGAPFSVESYLTGSLEVLPAAPPVLPQRVTGVWLVSTSNDRGVRWTGTTWKHSSAPRMQGTERRPKPT